MLHIVTQYLKKSATLYPNHLAFIDNKVTMTYEDTLLQAEKIAYKLSSSSLFKKPIAVLMDKGAATVVAFLGVALSGKHTGHRIELGEIEIAVFSNTSIKSNCCLHDSTKDQLVLFYVGDITEDNLRKYLSGLVLEYMLPNLYHKIDSMPLNLNGKIDRVKLKEQMNGGI